MKYAVWLSIHSFSRVFQSCTLMPRFPVWHFQSPIMKYIELSIDTIKYNKYVSGYLLILQTLLQSTVYIHFKIL